MKTFFFLIVGCVFSVCAATEGRLLGAKEARAALAVAIAAQTTVFDCPSVLPLNASRRQQTVLTNVDESIAEIEAKLRFLATKKRVALE